MRPARLMYPKIAAPSERRIQRETPGTPCQHQPALINSVNFHLKSKAVRVSFSILQGSALSLGKGQTSDVKPGESAVCGRNAVLGVGA